MKRMNVLLSIVKRGQGANIQKVYGEYQVSFHIQCSGRGTATSEIMDILNLDSTEKDVVFSFGTENTISWLLQALNNDLRGSIDAAGIVVSLPLSGINNLVANLAAYQEEQVKAELRGEHTMERTENSMILAICGRGYTSDIMATAKANGARGGTIIRARMAGLEELEQTYSIELEENREIVVIVVPTSLRAPIMNAINAEHGLNSKAQTVVCALPVEAMIKL
jgi:hypothetical protein